MTLKKIRPSLNPATSDAIQSLGSLSDISRLTSSRQKAYLLSVDYRHDLILKNRSHLPSEGYVRLKQILAPEGPIPVCKSTWWAGVKSGRYPKPTKHFGPGITAWCVKEIRALIARAELTSEDEKYSEIGGAK